MKASIDHAQWQYDAPRLSLQGRWQANQVAEVWKELPQWRQIAHIDLSAVTQIDSALIALLLKIKLQAGHPLSVSGVSDFIRALLGLYELQDHFVEVVK